MGHRGGSLQGPAAHSTPLPRAHADRSESDGRRLRMRGRRAPGMAGRQPELDASAAERLAGVIARQTGLWTSPGRSYGQALDLGCGSGIWAVKLAARGWQVTGVDFVPKALRRARERAQETGVEVRLIEGDVTALGIAGVGSGFQLLVDFGCFHDELSDGQREEEGREASAAAAPGATLLLMAFAPGHRGPLPRGASREDIEAAFPEWTVIVEETMDVSGAPRLVKRADRASTGSGASDPRDSRFRVREQRPSPSSGPGGAIARDDVQQCALTLRSVPLLRKSGTDSGRK